MDLKESLSKEYYGYEMCLYQNFWCPKFSLEPVIALQRDFQAYDTDIFVINMPKTGTTWLSSTMEEYFNKFCEGRSLYGPFFDHLMGYWKESLERPKKVLFLKYEDLKEDGVLQMKKVAEFVGFPFSIEEEKQGVVEDLIKLCSIESLKEMEVNKKGKCDPDLRTSVSLEKGWWVMRLIILHLLWLNA
ncbi:Flavonol 4'-sulfotransferase [Bienertia sinuspersici]